MPDPVGLAGCLAWHDASDASTLYDATVGGSLVVADGTVARWEDKSGGARHLLQATAANRPQRKTVIQNGYDCLLFDGTNDVVSTSSNFPETGNAEFSAFIVSKKLTAAKGALYGWGEALVSLAAYGLYDDGTFKVCAFAGGNGYFIEQIGIVSFHLHSFLKSAGAISTTSTARKDKVNTATSGHSATTPDIEARPLNVGIWSNYTSQGSVYYHGYVSELVIYDSKLSDVDRNRVEDYLFNKWIAAIPRKFEGGMFGGISGRMTGGMRS